MKRLLSAVGVVLAMALIAGGIAWWRTHQETEAALRQFGLLRTDSVVTQLQDTIARYKAGADSLRQAELRTAARAADAKRAYLVERRELLSSMESAREALALTPDTTSHPPPAISACRLVDSAQLAGTFRACDVAIAAAEVRADSAAARADNADSLAARAEHLAARADSGRLAAIDSATRILKGRSRDSLKRTAKVVAVTIGVWEVVRLALGAVSGRR